MRRSPTINPTRAADGRQSSRKRLTPEEVNEKQLNELPIRFGGPLFSKLKRKYWELEHCRDLPFVIAIEAFHEEGSLGFSSHALGQYLYGLRGFPSWTESGQLVVDFKEIEKHELGTKVIPSNFFGQPDAAHVSAVLFSNSGTWSKFTRMGYLAGYHRGNVKMVRTGTSYNPDPNSGTPLSFSYDLDDPPWEEEWGQGLVLIHNPTARHPLPKGYFPAAVDEYLLNGKVVGDVPRTHVYGSLTGIVGAMADGIFRSRRRVDARVRSSAASVIGWSVIGPWGQL